MSAAKAAGRLPERTWQRRHTGTAGQGVRD
jgi:hypothetical protein